MSLITGKYIRKEETIKQITISRKFSVVLSIINNETMSQRRSLEILMVINLIPAFSLPYSRFLNIIYTTIFKTAIKNITIKLSRKFILQK